VAPGTLDAIGWRPDAMPSTTEQDAISTHDPVTCVTYALPPFPSWPRWHAPRLAAVAALTTLAACAPDDVGPTPGDDSATTSHAVLYGDDNRLEYYEAASAEQALAASTTTLIFRSTLVGDDGGPYGYDAESLADDDDVCADEWFADQPTASECSAFLIDDRLVVTAGHCIDDGDACPEEVFLFGYWYTAEGEFAAVTDDDIYTCRRVIAFDDPDVEGGVADYAVIELDRPVTSATPLAVDTARVRIGDELTLIGYPDQLPVKIAGDGQVIGVGWRDGTAFGGTVDAFGGNSGSAVFDDDGEVVGILVAGEEDYVWDEAAGCNRYNVLPQDGGDDGGETITSIGIVVQAVCESGYPSERLCDAFGECGDGFCTGDEDFASCEEDCSAGPGLPPPGWTCDPGWYDVGDDCDCECGLYDPELDIYRCDDGEICNAFGECQPEDLPEGWTCDPGWYGVGDDCDCDCGAYDPDCDDPSLDLLNCESGQFCNADGDCEDTPVDPDPDPEPEPDAGTPDAGPGADTGGEDTGGEDAGGDDVAEADTTADSGAGPDASNDTAFGGSGPGGCAAGGSAPHSPWLLGAIAGLAWRRRRLGGADACSPR